MSAHNFEGMLFSYRFKIQHIRMRQEGSNFHISRRVNKITRTLVRIVYLGRCHELVP
jgi:hypothetical protein